MSEGSFDLKVEEALEEIRIKFSIKKKPLYSLIECLNCYTKSQLIEVAKDQGLCIKESQKKSEMIEVLEKTLIKNIARDSLYLTSEERKLLFSIINCDEVMDMAECLNSCNMLESIGYVFTFYYKKGFHYVCPKEIAEIFINKCIDENEAIVARNQNIYKYSRALINIYGVYEIEQLILIWNMYEDIKLDRIEACQYMDIMGHRQNFYWWLTPYVVSDCFDNQEDFQKFLEKTPIKNYYMPTEEEINFYSEYEYDENSLYNKELLKYFKGKKHLIDKDIAKIVLFINMDIILNRPIEETVEQVLKKIRTFDNERDLNYFYKLYINLSNNTRMWSIKGYKPVELSESKDSSKKKIGRNDQCPCGSGKKYKHCCAAKGD